MNKYYTTLLTLLAAILIALPSQAQQNLLPQPSFESFITCPNSLSDIAESYWDKAPFHSGSSDYFNACAVSTACDVPTNTFGTSAANTGVAYAGGYCGLATSPYREYICDTLSQTLIAGTKYVVNFHYRLASNARYSSNDMGFYLSSALPTGTGTGNLGVTPTSWNPSGGQLQNNTSWQLYTDTIIASGGEQYITIGAFLNSPTTVLYNTSANINGAYYWWDDVHVILLEGIDGDTNICLGDSAQIWSLELDSVSWRDSLNPTVEIGNGDTITVGPTVTTTYMAVVPGDTYYFTVNVVSPISGFLGNDTSVCDGETVIKVVDLSSQGPYEYEWSNGQNDSALITQDSGTYTLEVSLYGCSSYDTFDIDFHSFPVYELGPDTTICWYDSITIDPNVQGAVTGYSWSTGATSSSIVIQTPGTYWVDISNVNCTMRDSMDLTYHPTVVVDLGPDKEFCYSTSEPLAPNAQNASTFTWSTGTTGPSAQATTTGMYYVTATGNGCNAFDSVHYTFYYDPYFDLPETLMYCDYDTAILETGLDTTGLSFVWNTGSTSPTIEIEGGSQGNYWVQVTGEHCTMRDTIYVGMHPPIGLELGDDIPACEGDSITVTPNTNPLFDYTWSNGSIANTLTVSESGVYDLTVTNGFCTETDKIRVFFYEYPEVDLGSDLTLCGPMELNFDVTSPWDAVVFAWYDGTTSPLHTMYADKDDTLWVRATNFVCSSTDTVHIHIAEPPTISLRDDTILCENRIARVKAKGNPTWEYTWSNGDSTQILVTNASGIYTVTVSDGVCSTKDSIEVYDLSDPTVDIFGPEYICLGEIESLDASIEGAFQYKWSTGASSAIIPIYEPGEYVVEVTHACGVAIDSIFVEDCECFLRFPSAFRPTPSGVNKTFGAEYDCDLTQFKLRIFNRWGETLFYTEDPAAKWDGRVNSQLVPSGAYGWICEYKGLYDGEKIIRNLQGNVVVLK